MRGTVCRRSEDSHVKITLRPPPLTELPDVHDVVLVLQHRRLVVVDVEVVRGAEDGHDAREGRGPSLPIHPVAGILGLVRSDDGEQVVLLQEGTGGRVREEVRASPNMIMNEVLGRLLLPKVLQRVGPQDVTHQSVSGRLAESVNLSKVSHGPHPRSGWPE